MLLVLFLCCGVIVQQEIPLVSDFILGLPGIGVCWTRYFAFLSEIFPFPNAWFWITLVLCWLIPLAVCSVPALLVYLCYDPVLPHMPDGGPQLQAKELKNLCKQTQTLRKRSSAGIATACNLLFLFLAAVLLTVFIVQTFVVEETDFAVLQSFGNLSLTAPVAAFGILLGYALLNYLLLKLLGLLHICRLPKQAVEAIECYHTLWCPPKGQQYGQYGTVDF